MNSHSSQLTSNPHHTPKHREAAAQPAPKPSTLAVIRQFARLYDFNAARHPSLNNFIPN